MGANDPGNRRGAYYKGYRSRGMAKRDLKVLRILDPSQRYEIGGGKPFDDKFAIRIFPIGETGSKRAKKKKKTDWAKTKRMIRRKK